MSTTPNPVVEPGKKAPTGKAWPPNGGLSNWIAGWFPPGYKGYAVDVGASDGISVNSTYVLEENRWTVLCIEPNPIFWPTLKKLRTFMMGCACDAEPKDKATFYSFNHNPESYSALRPTFPQDFPLEFGDGSPSPWTILEVPVKTLDQCLTEAQFPRLDVLCVDVEGTEVDVLRGIDLQQWKPKVIIVEAWTEDSLNEYLEKFGYRKRWRTAHNDCYTLSP